MEIPRDIDKIIALVKNQFPEANVEQLKVKFPADDNGIWFFSIAGNLDDELQIESPFGQCPFLIETRRNNKRRNGKTVNQVVSIICEHLKTSSKQNEK